MSKTAGQSRVIRRPVIPLLNGSPFIDPIILRARYMEPGNVVGTTIVGVPSKTVKCSKKTLTGELVHVNVPLAGLPEDHSLHLVIGGPARNSHPATLTEMVSVFGVALSIGRRGNMIEPDWFSQSVRGRTNEL
jgi:hypothetical protein